MGGIQQSQRLQRSQAPRDPVRLAAFGAHRVAVVVT